MAAATGLPLDDSTFALWRFEGIETVTTTHRVLQRPDSQYGVGYSTTEIYRDITWDRDGFLSFSWFVDSELNYDNMRCYVDDVVVLTVNGPAHGGAAVIGVTAGTHRIRFTYGSDGSVFVGQDIGKVWDITCSYSDTGEAFQVFDFAGDADGTAPSGWAGTWTVFTEQKTRTGHQDETGRYMLQNSGGAVETVGPWGQPALAFSRASNSILSLPPDAPLLSLFRDREWTLEFWARYRNDWSNNFLFCLAGPTGDGISATNYIFRLHLTPDVGAAPLYAFWEYGTGSDAAPSSGTRAVVKEAWTHIAVSRKLNDDGTCWIKFYANGILVGEAPHEHLPEGGEYATLYIGGDVSGGLNGDIAEIRISDRVRTDAELRAVALAGLRLTNPVDDATPSEHPLDDHTLCLWRLNEAQATDPAVDSTGRLTLAASGSPPPAAEGLGRSFNGSSQWFSAAANSDDWLSRLRGELTLEAWIRPLVFGIDRHFLAHTGPNKTDVAADNYYIQWKTLGNSGYQRWLWEFDAGTNATLDQTEGATPRLREWVHVAAVRRPGIGGWYVDFYVDGTLVQTAGPNNNPPNSGTNNWMYLGVDGPYQTEANGLFVGTMDDVRISSVARTPEEIHADYLRGTVYAAANPHRADTLGPIRLELEEEYGALEVANTGTLGGTWTPVNEPWFGEMGRHGRGVDFRDAVRRRITSASGICEPQQLTLYLWVYLRGLIGYPTHLIHKHYRNNNTWTTPWLVAAIQASTSSYPGRLEFVIKRVGQSGTNYVNSPNGALPYNRWTMVAMTYDGNSIVGYVDGQRVATAYYPGVLDYVYHGPWQTGDPGGGAVEYTNAILDDINILDIALTETEVAELYQLQGGRVTIDADLFDYLDAYATPLLREGWVSDGGDAVWLQFNQPLAPSSLRSHYFTIPGLQVFDNITQPEAGVLRIPVSEMKVRPYTIRVREGLTSAAGGYTRIDTIWGFVGIPPAVAGKRNFEIPHWLGPRMFYPRGAWRTAAGRTRYKVF